ncbi:MAG TPA: hypothetical protein VIL68_05890 [Propionibacteriaceae bacterium]
MNPSELPRLIADAFARSTPYAVEAESDLYAENSAGAAYAEPIDLGPLIEKLRAGGVDVQVARIESSGPRTVECPECFEQETILRPSAHPGHVILSCGHTAVAS